MNLANFQSHEKLFYGLDLAKKDSQLAIQGRPTEKVAPLFGQRLGRRARYERQDD